MSELIDKNAVKGVICAHCNKLECEDGCALIREVDKLPNEQLERNTGYWKYAYFAGEYECSVCGHYEIDAYDYCPHCGATMILPK